MRKRRKDKIASRGTKTKKANMQNSGCERTRLSGEWSSCVYSNSFPGKKKLPHLSTLSLVFNNSLIVI